MRLDFNVLWLDDQPDHIGAQFTRIKTRMEEEGFYFNPTLCKSMDEVRRSLTDHIFTDEIDLILVDWDLGSNLQGQDAIAEIRESVQYKDVVFYSAQNPADKLRMLAADKSVEGIYCTSREDLVEEVLGVFNSLVKKVLDLDHTRGIVMGATCDIDHMVNECLAAMYAQCGQEGQEALLKKAQDYVLRRKKDHEKRLARLSNANTITDFFKEYMVFTSADRLSTLAAALKYKGFEAHRAYRGSVVRYKEEAVKGRNSLGHQVLVPSGKASGVTDGAGTLVTLDEMRELRRLILGLRGEFQNLMIAIRGDPTPVIEAASMGPK